MSLEFWLGLAGTVWFIAFLFCMLNAYVPDRSGPGMTRRTKARLILTGWFFPIAAPIWLGIFVYFVVLTIATGLYNTFNTAFSKNDGGRIY